MARLESRSEMEAFVRSVELGGFSAAARDLRLTPSAVSKLVGRLEGALQTRLLNRTTRKVAPTAEGELFLARCRQILAEMEGAENEVGKARQQPRGRLRVHVGVGFGTHQLVPALPGFLDRYPEVQVELIVEDREPDLAKEGIDISVWPGAPEDSSLVARKLCDFERVLCASPVYLTRHGVPRAPDDLARHNCIVVAGLPAALAPWTFDTATGRHGLQVRGSVSANNAECALQLALRGVGIARLNEFMVSEQLRKGALVQVLAESHSAEPLPLHALYPRMRHRLPRVAAMLEFMIRSFSDAPWRTARPTLRKNQPAVKR